MNTQMRRYFTAEKKARIVRRHLADKDEVSESNVVLFALSLLFLLDVLVLRQFAKAFEAK